MARKKAAAAWKGSPGVPEFVSDSTEYVTNHPKKINWKKATTTVRSFVKSNKATLKKACRGYLCLFPTSVVKAREQGCHGGRMKRAAPAHMCCREVYPCHMI